MSVRIAGRRGMWGALALGLGLVGPLGCREPHDVVPVAPPGMAFERTPVGPQTEAQAIGETGPVTPPQPKASPTSAPKSPPTAVGVPTKTASGLMYKDTKVGTGPSPATGQSCKMHYTGWLYKDGKKGSKFDSSLDRGEPFDFNIGEGQVIKGWDEGVATMKVGGKRTLVIPPDLGYGARGAGRAIPPNATLLFEVELLGVR